MNKHEMIEKAARLMYEEDGVNFDPYPYSHTRSTWEEISVGTRNKYMRKALIAWQVFGLT